MNSLSDGGAHCGTICDAASPTFMLQHWVRDRKRGSRIPLEVAIKRQCSDTARLYGLEDRGVIAPGYLADLNLIDMNRLKLGKKTMVRTSTVSSSWTSLTRTRTSRSSSTIPWRWSIPHLSILRDWRRWHAPSLPMIFQNPLWPLAI